MIEYGTLLNIYRNNQNETGFLNTFLIAMVKEIFLYLIMQLSTVPLRHMGTWRYNSTILNLGTIYDGYLHTPATLPLGLEPPVDTCARMGAL
jgi:hypothetical protein